MNKKKIVGTGLTGLVGSRIVELLSDNYEFIDFSINSQVNILDPKILQSAFESHKDADAIIHLAAFTDTNAAWLQNGDKNGLCYDLNYNGTKNILELCQKHNKYLINISTDYVFDGTKDGAYTEEDIPNPIEWYGATKAMAEKLILDSQHPASIVRISFPYRAKFEPKKDLVRKAIEALNNQSLNPLFADQITTTTFVDDIANGLRQFFERKPEGIFHLVGSSSQSPYDMGLKIAEVFGFDKSLIKPGSLEDYVNSLPLGSRPWQKKLSLSNDKVKKLGINMRTLEEGLLEIKRQISG